jgi:hypothetical protein
MLMLTMIAVGMRGELVWGWGLMTLLRVIFTSILGMLYCPKCIASRLRRIWLLMWRMRLCDVLPKQKNKRARVADRDVGHSTLFGRASGRRYMYVNIITNTILAIIVDWDRGLSVHITLHKTCT